MAKAKNQTSRGQKEDRARRVADRIPIVEVTAPDGSKSLWVAAVARDHAVAAVAPMARDRAASNALIATAPIR